MGSSICVQVTRRPVTQYAVLDCELDAIVAESQRSTFFGSLASACISVAVACFIEEHSGGEKAFMLLGQVGGLSLAVVFGLCGAWSAWTRRSLVRRIRRASELLEPAL
jgi:hypothetical protein